MEEFLQRAKSKLNQSKRLEKVHVVIGHKSCDLDSLISAFTYAYFLDKVSPPGVLCLPVLNVPRTEFSYFTETKFILEELNISESSHIFRDEINLHQLNDEGKLSITLIGSNELASEDKALESAVVKVISPVEQSDAVLGFGESSSSLVVKEILQEAPELITEQLAHLLRGSILFKYMTMESEKISEKQEEILSILEEKFPNLPPREDIITVLQESHSGAQGLSIEQILLKDLKELTDGEIKVAISTVNMTLENCVFHGNITSDLKAFADKFGFDVLILLASYLSEEQQPRRQIAVYSENLELCSQICCELEECQNLCLELEPFECGCDEILVYQQANPAVTCDQVVLLVKEVINRRCPEMISNSRTSSTEAVAGSAPLSQGSSGIMELYGSDIEPQPNSVNFIENPPDLNDSNQAQVDANTDLVSPDSGLATIRSSRSSKESSVFLSDDSPVGEGAGPHHSLLPGFDSYSPIPEGAVVEEHALSRAHGEHFDLFGFDPTPMVSGQSQPSSHSADYSPSDDFFPNSDSSEGQLPLGPKELSGMGMNMSNYSSSSLLSEPGKDNLVEFDEEFVPRQESPGDNSQRHLSLTDFVGEESLSPGKGVPPTPVNSFVESSSSTDDPALLCSEDLAPETVDAGHSGPPQPRARCRSWWGGLEMDSKTIADAWSSGEQESVFQSPESWKDHKPSPGDRRASDSVFQPKSLEGSKPGPWESEFGQPRLGHKNIQDQREESLQFQNLPTEKSHLADASSQGTNHLIEDFAALWRSDRSPTAMPEPWGNPMDGGEPAAAVSFPAWGAFGKENDTEGLKNTWNLHPVSGETPPGRDPNEWVMAKTGYSFPAEDLGDRSPSEASNEAAPEIWGQKNHDSGADVLIPGNPRSDPEHAWNSPKPTKEDQDGGMDPKLRGKVYEKVDSWNLFEESVRKRGSDILAPWEDSFLSYECSDYSASNIGEDSVPSPLDTNYSTSDSYTSPTFAADEKETENKPLAEEGGFETKDANSTTEEAEIPPQSPLQPPRHRISSGPGNLEMWGPPHADTSSERNATHSPDGDVLRTEPADDKDISVEEDVGESSQSSYDDPSMMQMYNETNRQLTLLHSSTNSRQAVPDNLDLWNRVILEDTQSTATISDNDLDWDDCSAGVVIPGEGQAQGHMAEGTEPETRFSVRQLEPWGMEYQEATQADWGLPASNEHSEDAAPNEHHVLNEKSGQLIANSIWDSVMRDNDMSSLMLPGPANVTDAEQSRMPSETPSSEKIKDSTILDVPEASGASESGALGPDQENTCRGNLPGDTAASLATRLENPGHVVCSDPWEGPRYGQSEDETETLRAVDREHLSEEEVMEGASGTSRKGQGDQECSPLVVSEHEEIRDESSKISSHSVTSSPQTEEPQEALEQEKGSYNPDPCDVQTEVSTDHLQAKETCEKHLENHRDSGETTDISEKPTLTKNVSLPEMDLEITEECNTLEPERVNQEPPPACPQSLDVWDVPTDSDVQVSCTSSEITTYPEGKSAENSPPGAISSGNYDRESVSSECSHSSTSSLDLNDSSAAQLSWDQGTNTGHQKETQDDWNKQNHQESGLITTDGQAEVITEMNDPEKNRMDKFERSLGQKVPTYLEIWNDSIDGDSFSSLSSPETGKYSEYSGAYQERNLVVSHQEKNEHDIPDAVQSEDAKFMSTSSGSDDDSAGDESVEEEGHLVTCQVAQSEPRTWDSLNESKFLDVEDPKSEELSAYVVSSEPAGNENTSDPFCDNPQSSADHSNFSPLKETETQMIAVDKETRSPETGAGNIIWQISPKTEPKNENNSKLEMLDFPVESTEWWNAPLQEGQPTESAFEGGLSTSGGVLEMNSSVYQHMGPWGIPIQGDMESMDRHCTNPFSDEHQSPFLDSNVENSHEQLWNIQPRQQPDPEADQLSQLVILDQIKEKDPREQTFMSSAGDKLTSETPRQEQCHDTVLSVWDQPDPAFTQMDENRCVTSSVSTIACQETNWWEEEKSYPREMTNSCIASKDFPAVSSSTQLIKKTEAEWDGSTLSEGPQSTFVPDILHGNFQEGGQLASASPDLWVDAKQPFSLKADGENPDILTHCDQDSNSQAPNSPDICHEHEATQETGQHVSARMGPEGEAGELYLTEPKLDEEPNHEPGQEFVPYSSEPCSETKIPLPPRGDQENTNGSSQPAASHSGSPEPSDVNEENNTGLQASEEGADPETAPVWEPTDRTVPMIKRVGTAIFVTHQEPTMEGSHSWISEDFSPESPTGEAALLDLEQPLTAEEPASVPDALLVSDTCLDVSEAALEHSFSDASGLNTSTGTIDDMSKLTLSEGNTDTPVDGEAGKQDICSSEASWGDFECDVMGQNIDEDLTKEPEHFLYGGDHPMEEDALKQSLTPYTPPFDLSYLTEPAPGVKPAEEAGTPEDKSMGSEAGEIVLSTLPDQRSKDNHPETQISQPGHQLVVLHIHEDPESVSLPVRGDSNMELSPSNIDWEVETEKSDSPAGGDIGPPNGASKGIFKFEEEAVIPTQEPEPIKPEFREERNTEQSEDHQAQHLDYILVNHEENSPPEPEAFKARESTSESEEFHVGSKQTGLPETHVASFSDTCQSDSLSKRQDHSAKKMTSEDDKRSSLESPGQEQSWMVLGHSQVGNLSGAMDEGSDRAVEPASDHNLGMSPQMQALGETAPLESVAIEEAPGLCSQSQKSKSEGRAGPDTVMLQTVAHDNEWEMISPQPLQKNIIPETEMEEETEFLEPRTRKPRPTRPLPEDVGMDIPFEQGMLSPGAADMRPEPPSSLDLNDTHPQRIKLTAPNINLSLDQSEGSVLSDDNLDSPDEIDINVDELDTPDEADSFEYTGHENPTANKDSGQESESIPEYTAEEEREDNRLWRTVVIGEQEQRIDMKVIEPFRRVISHGGDSGYYGDGLNAIIVFASCFLPDSSRADYHYVMENLFLYVISTLELMVAEDYMIVYLNGATPRRKMPGLGWMKKCYQMIDRRLRKNLKSFIIVHPSWFIRTLLAVTRPFISSKFSSKIKYVSSLSELSGLIPMDCVQIPESIIKYDEEKSHKRSVRLDEELREASEATNLDLKLKEKP